MNTLVNKSQENTNQSSPVSFSPNQTDWPQPSFQFVDNRPESIAQKKYKLIANHSKQTLQLLAFQKLANHNLRNRPEYLPGNNVTLNTIQRIIKQDRVTILNLFKHWRTLDWNKRGARETVEQYINRYETGLAPDTLSDNVKAALTYFETEKSKAENDPFKALSVFPDKDPELPKLTLDNPQGASISVIEWASNSIDRTWEDDETARQHSYRYKQFLKAQKNEDFSAAGLEALIVSYPRKINSNEIMAVYRTWVNTSNYKPSESAIFLPSVDYRNPHDALPTQEALRKINGETRILKAADALTQIAAWELPSGTETPLQFIERFRLHKLASNIVLSAEAITALKAAPNSKSDTFNATTAHPSVSSPSNVTLFPTGLRISKEVQFGRLGDFAGREAAFQLLKNRFITAVNGALSNKFSIRIQTPIAAQAGDGTYPIHVSVNEDNAAVYVVNLIGGQHGTSSVGANSATIYELGLPTEAAQSDITMAHEGAHLMLGASDEYADATYAARPLFTDHSLMGNYYLEGPDQARIKARHFGHVVTKIGEWFPARNVTIV